MQNQIEMCAGHTRTHDRSDGQQSPLANALLHLSVSCHRDSAPVAVCGRVSCACVPLSVCAIAIPPTACVCVCVRELQLTASLERAL